MRLGCVFVTIALVLSWSQMADLAGTRVVRTWRGARVTTTAGDRAWSIGNERITFSARLDDDSNLVCEGLRVGETGRVIGMGDGPDTAFNLDAVPWRLGATGEGWAFDEVVTSEGDGYVRLGFTYRHAERQVTATRWFAVPPQAPVVEAWTTFVADGGPVLLSGVNLWNVTLPAGDVDWVSGLQVSEDSGGRFTRQRSHLEPGDRLALGAQGRSSESTLPWFALNLNDDVLFAGLLWSGGWGATLLRHDDSLLVDVGLPATSTTVEPGTSFETPHLFVGVAAGPAPDVAGSLRRYLRETLRSGRGWEPLVTYNTWFAYGTRVDEDVVRAELDGNAALGTELFVLDAGWYPSRGDYWDYSAGLGSWEVDAERFPHGLAVLGDRARHLGMKFGIWVEPERVDLAVVHVRRRIPEAWLATVDGRYDPGRTNEEATAAQICLGHPEARRWVLGQLLAFVREHRPDYLKWDNNFWVNCDRPGHGHGTGDGNLHHVRGLYEVLRSLRVAFPTLVIENVSGGGNRLDFGVAALTDVAWMDDQSAPSTHVRHNLEGLSQVFPPGYLLSFLMAHPDEPVADAPDIRLYARSRMPGVLGLCFRSDQVDGDVADDLRQEIERYKDVRDVLRDGSLWLLTPQASAGGGGGGDALQGVLPEGGRSVLFAYRGTEGPLQVRPVRLDPQQTYTISTFDLGMVGQASGASLMAHGIGVSGDTATAAQVIVLTPAPAGVPAARTRMP